MWRYGWGLDHEVLVGHAVEFSWKSWEDIECVRSSDRHFRKILMSAT